MTFTLSSDSEAVYAEAVTDTNYTLNALRKVLEAVDRYEYRTKLEGIGLTIYAPEGYKFRNGEHGLLIDITDREDIDYANHNVFSEYAECKDPEGCDVCDYGADLDNA